DLPAATATSLLAEQPAGLPADLREQLLIAILRELAGWYTAWAGPANGDPDACGLRPEYLRRCATAGRDVRVTLPGGQTLAGRATGVDRLGRLAVRTPAGPAEVSAGDVVHVR
ncbi:MAG: biotin--[acetyl-CoA-carboxylase] ligase, partial [Actinobacteria bacterium]|nr:biotin--[acetyl-CoA-carboxylase] ligase [Actinomycetota bacterium]